MSVRGRNKNLDNEGQNGGFKHYKVMVKILQDKKVEYQNLEIFTRGLPQLLEIRRLHNHAFADAMDECVPEMCRKN